MALDNIICPEGDLTTIDVDVCKPVFGKVRTLIFQKNLTSNNFVTAVNGIETSAAWSGLSAASGTTKVVILKNVKEVKFAETSFIEGTENYDGANTIDGVKPQIVTVIYENPTAAQISAVRDLEANNRSGNLGVFFVDGNEKIRANVVSTSPLTHGSILISSDTFGVMIPSREGTKGAKFIMTIQFALSENWQENSADVSAETGFSYNNDVQP